MKPKYWTGEIPARDQFGYPVGRTIIDGRTVMGSWALMTPRAFALFGLGRLGPGYGQQYEKQNDGQWLKVAG